MFHYYTNKVVRGKIVLRRFFSKFHDLLDFQRVLKPFLHSGLAGLDEITIGNHEKFSGCAVQTFGRYAAGRVEVDSEDPWLDVLDERFQRHDLRFKALMLEVIMSPVFRQAGPPKEEEGQ